MTHAYVRLGSGLDGLIENPVFPGDIHTRLILVSICQASSTHGETRTERNGEKRGATPPDK